MDSENLVVTFCLEGICAELEEREDDARICYRRAWNSRTNDYEACLAAHYLARAQDSAEDILHWNLKALELAFTADQEKVRDFYPSLYMSVAHSYKQLGGSVQAQRYYRLAAGLGEITPVESEGAMIRWLKVFDWVQPMLQDAIGD